MKKDAITLKRIESLHPLLRSDATKIYEELLFKGITIRYTRTLSTFKEQDAIYMQGRSTLQEINAFRKSLGMYEISEKENRIVTHAKGGRSMHNYGLAIDICILIAGHEWDMRYDGNNNATSDWMEIVEIFKKYGWDWGAEINFKADTPHFQKTFGKSIDELYQAYKNNKFMPNEKHILIP